MGASTAAMAGKTTSLAVVVASRRGVRRRSSILGGIVVTMGGFQNGVTVSRCGRNMFDRVDVAILDASRSWQPRSIGEVDAIQSSESSKVLRTGLELAIIKETDSSVSVFGELGKVSDSSLGLGFEHRSSPRTEVSKSQLLIQKVFTLYIVH